MEDTRLTRIANQLHSSAIHLLRRARTADRDSGLTAERLSVLSVLCFGGPRTVGELADAELVSRPAISRIVSALEREGLVVRERSEADRRKVIVRATRRGRGLMDRARRRRLERVAAQLGDLSARQLDELGSALSVLRSLAASSSEERRARPAEPVVRLEPVVADRDEALLTDWLEQEHVTRWWHDPEERFREIRAQQDDRHAFITADERRVGYMRWQPVSREELDELGLDRLPDDSIDIDLFLGDAGWRGRGIGPAALRLLLQRLREAGCRHADLCTSVHNTRAIRAFEKVGFRKHQQYDDPIYGRCWTMLVEL